MIVWIVDKNFKAYRYIWIFVWTADKNDNCTNVNECVQMIIWTIDRNKCVCMCMDVYG